MNSRQTPVHGTTIEGIEINTRIRTSEFVMTGHHCHKWFELFYVESGTCRFLINDSIHDIHQGDFILIPPYALHYTRYLFGTCKRTVIFFRQEDLCDSLLPLKPLPLPQVSQNTILKKQPCINSKQSHTKQNRNTRQITCYKIWIICIRKGKEGYKS